MSAGGRAKRDRAAPKREVVVTVRFPLSEGVLMEQAVDYVHEAVASWSGQFALEDPHHVIGDEEHIVVVRRAR